MSKWYVGQRIVAVLNEHNGYFKKGDEFVIKAIDRNICKCPSFDFDIGFTAPYDLRVRCGNCKHMNIEKEGTPMWYDEAHFAPLQERSDETDESILETIDREHPVVKEIPVMDLQTAKLNTRQVREEVLDILGWSAEQYHDFVIDMAMEYVADVLGFDDRWTVEGLMSTKGFWRWWRNQWAMIDEQVFLPAAFSQPDHELTYKNVHSPWFLKAHPTMAVFEDSYDKMIVELNRTLTENVAG